MVNTQESLIRPSFLRRPHGLTATLNERIVLDIVRREGMITRAEIARRTKLTAMSISRLVDELIQRGLVQNSGRIEGSRGQNIGVEIVRGAAYSVGIAVMTDTLSLALMDLSGAVLSQTTQPLKSTSQSAVIQKVIKAIDAMVREQGLEAGKLFGVCLSLSGYFIGDGKRVRAHALLQDWSCVDVEALLSDHLGLPAWIENDGNAAAVGESLLGIGRWAQNFAYLYIAAGFGGGIIQGGEQQRGTWGNAGEFAGLLPSSFERPTLELLRTIAVGRGIDAKNVSELLAQFDPDWPAVDEWIERVAPSLSLVASAISAILDPQAIVLGGRLPKRLAERLIPSIEIYASPTNPMPRPRPQILAAETQGEPTAIGAAAVPFKHHFYR